MTSEHVQSDQDATQSIVHVARFSPEYRGNFVASLSRLRELCQAQGWGFVLALPETARERAWLKDLLADGWQIRFLPTDTSMWDITRMLSKIISQEQARLVHTHFSDYDVAAWLAVRLAKMRGRRPQLVWHVHSELVASSSLPRRIRDFIKYRRMGRSVWIIPVWESVFDGVIKAGTPRERVRTIPNGIDLARATTPSRSRAQVRAELGIAETDRLILMFGIQPVNKGADLAIDATAELTREDPSVVLGIVGREKLQGFVLGRIGEQRPSWLRVIGPIENVADLYLAANVFVSASRSEGFSFAAVEAMANGLPVILSDIPGVSWAHRSEGAVFFESGNSAALASSIRRVLDWSPSERETHSSDNRRLVSAEFNVDVWADRVVEHYMEILDRTGADRPADK